jgi:tetratricopeptide (TPR) repeat protein
MAKLIMVNRLYKWLFFGFIWLLNTNIFGQQVTKDSIPPHMVLYNTASKMLDSSKYKEAIVILKKAIKIRPDFWEAYNKAAMAEMQLLDFKNAAKDLDKAEFFQAMNYETTKLKGIYFYSLGDFSASKSALDTAFSIAKEEKIEDPELFYYRALLMFKGKSHKLAIDACESAVELNPKYLKAMILNAEIRFAMKDYNYAIRELNKAIPLMPAEKPEYRTYKLRAISRFEVKDFKGSVADWNAYIDGVPGEEEALVSRGAAKINVNDNSGAISDFDEAIKLNPKNPVSYCYRGVAKGGNKNFTEALKDIDYAIKLKFDYGAGYLNRAAIKMASKDKRGACEDLEKADSLGDELAIKLIQQYCK